MLTPDVSSESLETVSFSICVLFLAAHSSRMQPGSQHDKVLFVSKSQVKVDLEANVVWLFGLT